LANLSNATDLVFFLLKSIIGGGAIFLIAIKTGLSAQLATYEVPIMTISCVMKSLTFGLGFHAFTTASYYLFSNPHLFSFMSGFM